MKYRLQDLIDIEQFQSLQDRLYEVYSFPSAIIDVEGNILTATAWQDVCTKFHRRNRECERECVKSNRHVLDGALKGEITVSYRCSHGLFDTATPIIVDGEHLGTFFTGQFFMEEPDLDFFRVQAQRYGFDEGLYLDAVKRVPIRSRDQLDSYLRCVKTLIGVISATGLNSLRMIEARQESEENERQFKAMFETASIGMAQADPHTGRWVRVNQKLCDITGYTEGELLALRVPEITHPEDREADWESFQRVIRGEEPHYRMEKRYVRKDGTTVWVNVNMTVIRDEAGQPARTMAAIEDISERKGAQDALRESEERYRSLFDQMLNGLAHCRMVYEEGRPPDFVYLAVNAAFESLTGLKGAVGRKVSEVIPGIQESDLELIETYGRVASTGVPERFEVYIDVLDMWFAIAVYSPRRDHFVALFDVITERKRAEEMLRESQAKLEAALSSMMDAVFISDAAGNFTHFNDGFATFHRFKDKAECAKTLSEYPNFIEVFMANGELAPLEMWAVPRALRGETATNAEYTLRRKDTGETWIGSYSFGPIRDKGGAIVGSVVVGRDITDSKKTEEALRESDERMHFALMVSHTGAWDLNLVDHSAFRTIEHDRIFGYEELLPQWTYEMFLEHVFADDREEVHRKFQMAMDKQGNWDFECRIVRPDGEQRWIWACGQHRRNAQGVCDRMVGIVQDITARKRAEEEHARLESQFQQAQKMESVGRLAGGVAHDFNNMLAAILGYAEIALGQVDPSEPLHDDLEEIRKAAERSADLTRQLLTFARRQTVAPKVLDLNETVSGVLKMLQRLIGEDIHLEWHPSANVWAVKVDPSQIDQILANLCVNARDAIADVGKITIETRNRTFDEEYCADHAGFVPGDYVMLAVSDDGCGMDRETLAHIFEPFFTTKGVGEGTGLGLATVYGAVRQNDGFVNVYSEPGAGTTFTVYLPRHTGSTGKARTLGASGPAPRGHETILLVEDEPSVLKLARNLLEGYGYAVLAARSPGEAIDIARQHPGEIHLLMTDVVMPDMNGRDLANNLLSRHPSLKCLFMSGYTANVIVHHGVLDEGLLFIQKPFSARDLAVKVREALDGG